jgi:hypothetical protein
LISEFIFAQWDYPVAVTSKGILMGKFVRGESSQNSIPAEITIDEARSISALNVLLTNKNDCPLKFKVREFQMTIIDTKDTISIKGEGEILNNDMIKKLQNIHSGAKIYFGGIIAGEETGGIRAVKLLAFEVK